MNSRRVDVYLPDVEATEDTAGHSEGWIRVRWSEVRLGDVLYIHNNEKIPADILLLGSSEKGCLPPRLSFSFHVCGCV